MPGLTYIANLVKSKAFKNLIILLVVASVVYYAIWVIYYPLNANCIYKCNARCMRNLFEAGEVSAPAENYNQLSKDRLPSRAKFTDIILNPVALPTTYTPGLEKALADYNCYFNPATITKLAEARAIANSTLTGNFNVVNSRINGMSTEIDNKLQELNYNLLKQIQKNYYNAHLLNNEREHQKTMLDDLPIRNI